MIFSMFLKSMNTKKLPMSAMKYGRIWNYLTGGGKIFL